MRILVVEDDLEAQRYLVQGLKESGHVVDDAADKGLQPGDVVLKIGSHAVKSPADVQSGIAEAKQGGRKSVLLLVARQSGGTGFVAVDIGQT